MKGFLASFNWILPSLRQYERPGLFAGVFVETFGLPIPGETMIIFFSRRWRELEKSVS